MPTHPACSTPLGWTPQCRVKPHTRQPYSTLLHARHTPGAMHHINTRSSPSSICLVANGRVPLMTWVGNGGERSTMSWRR
jgi:hypothetical protein